MPGGLNSSGCNGMRANSGDVCFQETATGSITPVPDAPSSIEFEVTMPGTDALTAASDIKAAYNASKIIAARTWTNIPGHHNSERSLQFPSLPRCSF